MVRRIGSGGFGVVYEVLDRERGARVALKTLAQLEPSTLYRFKKEFRALAGLRHPNLVELHELVAERGAVAGEGDWFFTMELVRGPEWLDYVRHGQRATSVRLDASTLNAPVQLVANDVDRDPRPRTPRNLPTPPRADEQRVRATLRQLVTGVAALHEAGKLHRDIKPSNVLVSVDDGRVVVVDFGIATELRERREHLRSDGGLIAGTPEYMAPEQATGAQLGPAADWYAVGMILYEALTGVLPFVGSQLEILLDKQRREPPAPREIVEDPATVPEDLDALCRDLLRMRPAARPSVDEILRRVGDASSGDRVSRPVARGCRAEDRAPVMATEPREHRVAASLLVGRDEELASLQAAYDAARGGRAVTARVHGRSGMGKTALVRAFLDGLPRDAAVVLAGRCYERESVPYKALDNVIDELSRHLLQLPAHEGAAVTPRDAGALVRLFPVLQRVAAIAEAPRRPVPATVDAHRLRQRAFGALRELFARLCDRRPVIVFIDDLQWGDADSAALLGELMAPPDAPALLLILGYRSEDADTSASLQALLEPRGARGGDDVRAIALRPLSRGDVETLAASLLGEEKTAEVVRSVSREAGGNPLFTMELVRYLQEDAEALRSGDLRLERLLQKRIAALEPDARRLLEVVAVAGRPIRIELAARGATLGREARSKAVDRLRETTLVRTAGTRATDILEPFHDRIREAVLSLLDDDTLTELHGELARVLRAAGESDPETLFVHFAAAASGANLRGSPGSETLAESAIHYAEEAAKKAAQALAFDRAAQFHRQALEWVPASDPRRAALQVSLGDALGSAGRGAEAADAYLAATESAEPGQRLELRRRAAEQLIVSGHVDKGVATIETVLAQVGLRLPESPLRALLGLIVMRLWLSVRGLRYREADPLAIPPMELTRIDVTWSLAAGLSVVDNVRAASFQTRNLLACLRVGEPSRLGRAFALEAIFVSLAGTAAQPRADRIVQLARELASRAPQPDSEALISLSTAAIAYFTGRYREAVEHSERFFAIHRDGLTPTRWELRATQYFGLCSLVYCGELEELRVRLPAYLREAQDRGDLFLSTNFCVGETNLLWLCADDAEGAERVIDEAMSGWSHDQSFQVQHWYALQSRAQIALYRGEGPRAFAQIEHDFPALQRSLLLRVQHTRVKARWIRARCALTLGTDAGRAIARTEARRLADERAAWASPLADLVRAAVAVQEAHGNEAVRRLRLAEAGFDRADLPMFAAATRARLGKLLLLGKDATGAKILEDALEWFRSHGVKRPERLAEVFAPGFSSKSARRRA